MNKKVRKCPYCDSEISYLNALSEISGGEHTCSVCNKNSNIIHDKKIYIPAAILLAIAVIGAVITLLLGGKSHLLLAAVFIIIPSLVFFIITPFYYELYPIKSEAITPVVRHKVKSKKRSQITPRAIKYEEKKRLEKEKKNMSKKENSFRSKLSKFVNTYIIVDDDDVQDSNVDNEIYEDQEKTRIAKALTDEQIKKIQKENLKPQENEKISDIDNIDPLSDEEESFSFVGSYTDRSAYERINSREPVYHSLNKITKVDFEYLPDYIDSINIDLNEIEEEDKENEEILSFFDSDENENLDVKKNKIFKSESITEKKTEKKIPLAENVRPIEYSSEDREEIEVAIEENNGEFTADFIDKEINNAIEESSGSDLFFDEAETDDILQDIQSEDDYGDLSEGLPYEQDLTDSNNESKTFQEELDLSEYRTSNYVEDNSIDINIDDTEEEDEEFNFIEEQEEIFEEQEEEYSVPENEVAVQEKKTEVTLINKKKSIQKSVNSTETVKKDSEPQSQISFFTKIKNKIILATEQERDEAFEREEQERKLEDKERRRKEKEKEKMRKEKALKKENSLESKEKKDSIESKNSRRENGKKKQQYDKSYDDQEKVVIESVKDKVSQMENKKISEEEKVKIIADRQNQEKKREQIEKLKIEQEKKRKKKEELRKAEQLKEERQKKAEQLRQKQAEKAKASQKKLKESTENRKTDNIKLTEINKVKTKVSQKQEQKRQELDKFFKD